MNASELSQYIGVSDSENDDATPIALRNIHNAHSTRNRSSHSSPISMDGSVLSQYINGVRDSANGDDDDQPTQHDIHNLTPPTHNRHQYNTHNINYTNDILHNDEDRYSYNVQQYPHSVEEHNSHNTHRASHTSVIHDDNSDDGDSWPSMPSHDSSDEIQYELPHGLLTSVDHNTYNNTNNINNTHNHTHNTSHTVRWHHSEYLDDKPYDQV